MKKNRSKEAGQAIVEFAIVMPVIILLLLGVVYFAMAFNLQMVLNNAAREGARTWASGRENTNPCCATCASPCDPIDPSNENGFHKNVVPLIRKYVSDNGYEGDAIIFEDIQVFEDEKTMNEWNALVTGAQDSTKVKLVILYNYELPAGGFSLAPLQLRAAYTFKRGS